MEEKPISLDEEFLQAIQEGKISLEDALKKQIQKEKEQRENQTKFHEQAQELFMM